MSRKPHLTVIASLSMLSLLFGASGAIAQSRTPQLTEPQVALGTAFTYQGQLRQGNTPVTATCDMAFRLYDAATGGNQASSPITNTLPITAGLFTVSLDFGGDAFMGAARWLDIQVRCPTGTGVFAPLAPRQELTATPYALYSRTASWGGLTGVPAGFADGIDNDSGPGGAFWSITGNPGTTASNYLGTTDNMTLTLAVSNTAALRLVPDAISPNLIGGSSMNAVTTGVKGATIGGGGTPDDGSGVPAPNRVTDDYGAIGGGVGNQAGNNGAPTDDAIGATVGGGQANTASGNYAAVGGGRNNTASDTYATVSGGFGNTANNLWAIVHGGTNNTASGLLSTVGGGHSNVVSGTLGTIAGGGQSVLGNPTTGNRVTDDYGTVGGGGNNRAGNGSASTMDAVYVTVGGGLSNTATMPYATIGGGISNTVGGQYATVGGGTGNSANNSAATVGGGGNNTAADTNATVGGGQGNAASADNTTVAGGTGNSASGIAATIAGGQVNAASGDFSTVGGGESNSASNDLATVGGGYLNTASGIASTVAGGLENAAQGDHSFAAGLMAKANHDGAFVWGDTTFATIASSATDQFIVRANGGFYFITTTGNYTVPVAATFFLTTTTGAHLTTGGAWTNASDRNAKANFTSVDELDILKRLVTLPIQSWNYRAEGAHIRHIGPTAQEFYAAFGVGLNDTSITTVDAEGVSLAAIQGLYTLVQEKDEHIAAQQKQIADMETRLSTLEQRTAQTQSPAAVQASSLRSPIARRSSGVQSPISLGWLLFGGLLLVNLGVLIGRRWPRAGGHS